jgi:short-subunit dehydrogenase
MNAKYDIKGKTALVTGANRGIGKAIVESLLNNGATKVYAAVRNTDSASPLVKEYGDKVVPIQFDLGEPNVITAAAEQTQDVQVVVNNAGVLQMSDLMSNDAIEALEFEMKINTFGLMRIAQAFAPILKANDGGAFVQVNSIASMKCFSDFATYSASKAAAYSITQALREILSQQGTAVLSVHPGPILTDMTDATGLQDIAEPPSVVAEGIISALKSGDFHLFPDSMAKQFESAYKNFADNIIEAS